MPSTLTSGSINLTGNTNLDGATLTGSRTTGRARTSNATVPGAPGSWKGDTLVAQGDFITLTGGVGQDSLTAVGGNNWLVAGTAAATLRGSQTASSTTNLVGNGNSTLQYAGGNNVFHVKGSSDNSGKTDQIIAATLGGRTAPASNSTVRTDVTSFDLGNTTRHGTGIVNIRNLQYTGSSNATLIGNALSNYITGGRGSDSLVAIGGSDTLDAQSSAGSTLVGNGSSILIGGKRGDTFVVGRSGDRILENSNSGTDSVVLGGSLSTYNLANSTLNGAGILNVENLVYNGSSAATLTGNLLNNSIKGGSGNNFLGGAGGRDTLDASLSSGSNTLVGSTNGGSSLIGGGSGSTNTFFISNNADTLVTQDGSTNSILSSASRTDLSSQDAKISSIAFTGFGVATLIGNDQGGTTLNAGKAIAATLGDGGGYADTILGGQGNNLFMVTSGANLGTHSIVGGSRSDTLHLTTADDEIDDAAFTNKTGIEVLRLSSNSSVTLAENASLSGISTVIGSTGSDTIDANGLGRSLTIDVSSNTGKGDYTGTGSNDLIRINSSALGNSTINGAGGTDTLQLSNGSATLDGLGDDVAGIDVLALTGGSNFISLKGGDVKTLTSGTSGRDTLDASDAGGDIVINASAALLGVTMVGAKGGSSDSTLLGGIGSDLIEITSGKLDSSSIVGGRGTNTLTITDASTDIDDALFGKVRDVQVLNLTSNSSVTLEGNAAISGISTVIAGTGRDTINASGFSRGLTIDASGNSSNHNYTATNFNDLIRITSGALASSTLLGGLGIDTLQIADGAADLRNFATPVGSKTSLEVLSLTGGSNQLSGIGASGVTLVSAGSVGGDVLDASNAESNIVLNASSAATSVTLIGSTLNNISSTLLGGRGSDRLQVESARLLSSSIVGGNGTDTLSVSNSYASLNDNSFARVTGVEVLSLGSEGKATLATNALRAGIRTALLGDGPNTLNAATYNTGITINASASNSADLITGGNAGDSIILRGGSELTGVIGSRIATINGGLGTDTLAFVNNSTSIELTGSNANVSLRGVEFLSLTGGENRISAVGGSGIQTILGGSEGLDFLDASTAGNNIHINAAAAALGSTLIASSSNASTLIGGRGNDSLQVSAARIASSSLAGGAGIDTLRISEGASLGDSAAVASFARMSAIEVVQLSGDSAVTLGSGSASAGIATVIGGTGTTSFTQSATNTRPLTLIGGTGANSFNLANQGQLAANSLVGGTSNDTLQLNSAATLTGASFGRLSSIEVLTLTGASSVTLDSLAAASGISTIRGGSGNSTFAQLAGNTNATTIIGGIGNDRFSVANDTQLTLNSLVGGLGTDTLQITSAATLTDASFGRLSGIEVLTLTGASSVTLDSLAAASRISTIRGGNGDTTFVQLADYTLAGNTPSTTLIGGTGTNSFSLANRAQLAANSLVGGTLIDTLIVGGSPTLGAADFGRIQNIEVLQLQGNGSTGSSVTLSSVAGGAQTAGIRTVITGTGQDTIDASAYTTALTIDATAAINSGVTLNGGTNGTRFIFSGLNDFDNSVLTGGGGSDTLQINSAVTLEGVDRFTSIDVLQLNSSSLSGSAVTLNSAGSGIKTLVGGDGDDTFVQLAEHTLPTTLNGGAGNDSFSIANSALLANNSVIGGAGNDTLQIATAAALTDASFAKATGIEALQITSDSSSGGSSVTLGGTLAAAGIRSLFGGSGNDTLQVTNATLLPNLYLAGGNGVDLLQIATAATLTDASFERLSSIESISLSGASSVTLDSLAAASGISTIRGGSGNTTFVQLAGNTNATTFIGGTGTNSFSLANQAQLAANSLVGGASNDTLQLNSAATLTDASFGRLSSIEVLTLTGASSVTLDNLAATSGISTIYGSSLNDTFVQLAGDTSANTIIGGAGNDRFSLANLGQLGANSIVGGEGLDTLQIASAAALNDNSFGRISGIEALQITSNSSVTLGGNARSKGISTVISGTGRDTIDASGYNDGNAQQPAGLFFDASANINNSITLTGSTGSDIIRIANSTVLLGSSIDGGSGGTDTLQVDGSGGLYVTDAFFTGNLDNIDVLQMNNTGDNYYKVDSSFSIQTLVGSTGKSTVDLASSDDAAALTYDLRRGTSYEFISTTERLQNATILGNVGANTLTLTDAGTIEDTLFANQSAANIGTLELASDTLTAGGRGSTVALGSNALASGISTVRMGSQGDTLDTSLFTGQITIRGGAGDDLVQTNYAGLSKLSFAGGNGADTLQFTDKNSYNITSLPGTFEALSFFIEGDDSRSSGNNRVQLSSGLSSLIGGNGNDSFDLSEFTTPVSFVIGGDQIALSTLAGGAGNDTLFIRGGSYFVNSDFENKSGIEAIALSNNVASGKLVLNKIGLANNAKQMGVSTIYGAQGGDIIDASSFGRAITVALNDSTLTGDLVVGGVTLGGDGDYLTAAEVLATNTITGDEDFINTLVLDSDSDLQISSIQLSNISGFQVLTTGNGDNTFTLDDIIAGNGISSVIGGSGRDTIDASNSTLPTSGFWVDGGNGTDSLTGGTGNDTILGGLGNDIITGSAGRDSIMAGVGDDLIKFASAEDLANATLDGGTGNNTLQITGLSQIINLGTSSNTSNIQTVQFAGGSNYLEISGIMSRAIGGTGSDTFNASVVTQAVTLDGGGSAEDGTGIDLLIGSTRNDNKDTFVLANSAGTYYGDTTQADDMTSARNFAKIENYSSDDTLVLSRLDMGATDGPGGNLWGNYSFGAATNGVENFGSETERARFGLYKFDGTNNVLIADIQANAVGRIGPITVDLV